MNPWDPIGSRTSDSKDEDKIGVVSYTSRWKQGRKAGNMYHSGQ